MKRQMLATGLVMVVLVMPARADAAVPRRIVEGLKNPESVVVAADGRIFVSVIGEFDKEGDGAVLLIDQGKAVPFATGLDDPKGLAAFGPWLFVADRTRVWRIDARGKAQVFAAAKAFPKPPKFLNDVAVDEEGTLYVSDCGDFKGDGAAVYRIDAKGNVSLVTDSKKVPGLMAPNGLVLDGKSFLMMLDLGTGILHRVRIADGQATMVAEGFGSADGITWDMHGRLYLTDWKAGKVFVIPRPGEKPVVLASGLKSAADLCYDPVRRRLLVPDMEAGSIVALPATVPGQEVDETPLPLETAVAFPKLKWTGWEPEVRGKPTPLRPILLTHAGDGSNRVFVATEHGVIHVFANDQEATATKVFLDLQDRVKYDDETNEEGFLGLAFHPRYKENGEFFVFYTPKKPKLVNVLSRFRVKKDDPNRADPASEEVLLRIERPYWNHDGGTLCFGPDGYLYVALGDGGNFNDPHRNGQNLGTILGKVLRIDVDRKDGGKAYAVPRDNPFVARKGAC